MNTEKANTNTVLFELWAGIERLAGCKHLQVEMLNTQATIGDALQVLQQKHPTLHDAIERCACAVGDTIVRRNAPLPSNQVIVLLPPVSGG